MAKNLQGKGVAIISVGVFVMFIMYDIVTGSRWPVITVWWVIFSYMVTWLVSKNVIKLLLQSVQIDMSGLVRFRKMWACLAASGRFLCGRSAIWVEDTMYPLGKVMGMGWFSLVLLTHGVSVVM